MGFSQRLPPVRGEKIGLIAWHSLGRDKDKLSVAHLDQKVVAGDDTKLIR